MRESDQYIVIRAAAKHENGYFREDLEGMMKQGFLKRGSCLALACTLALNLVPAPSVQAEEQTQRFEPTWESVEQVESAPEWFQDAKFGIYFHWGAFTTPEYGDEWYGQKMGEGFYSHHEATYGNPWDWPYHNFIVGAEDKEGNWVQFAPKLKSEGGAFDPEEWAQLFKDAGAQFAGPVMEHHDGYSMWDSDVTPWNSVDLGPKLDLARLFVDAIRDQDMKVFATLHHAYNLTSGWNDVYGHGGGFYRWVDDGCLDLWENSVPGMTREDMVKLYGKFDSQEEREAFWLAKLKEVIDKYDPDVIYQDFQLDQISEETRLEFLSYFYNKDLEENGDGVVAAYKYNYEYNDGFTQESAVPDYERGGPGGQKDFYWLTDESVSAGTWSYTEGMQYYSPKSLIHALADRISKNGNMVLNIAPRADGSIPQEQKDILLEIGSWLNRYGEAVYNTRAWSIYGEGPTLMGGGHWGTPREGGETDIRFTASKDQSTLYAIAMGWPEDGVMDIKTLKEGIADETEIQGIYLADGSESPESLQYEQDGEGLHITLPETKDETDANGYAVKIVWKQEVPQPEGVTFYTDNNYQGTAMTLVEGDYDENALRAAGVPIDAVSSIQVPAGYTVYAYDWGNFDQTCWILEKDMENLGAANDGIASLRIVKNEETLKEVAPEEGKTYKIVLRNNPDYVLSYAGEAADDVNVQINLKAEESPNQEWMFIPVEGEEGYYRISPAVNTQVCVDINWGWYENGRNLNLYTYGEADNQKWSLEPTGSGYYVIRSKGDSWYCIDESEVTPQDGSNVQLWQYVFSDRQHWRLEEVGGEPELEQTAAPAFGSSFAVIASPKEKTAAFPLSNALEGGTYQVYAQGTEGEALADPAVSVSGGQLLLSFTQEPESGQVFYISAKEAGKTESERTAVSVVPYVSGHSILKSAIDSAKALQKEQFTEESYAALKQALESAQAAYERADLTPEEAQEQTELLAAAVGNLKAVGNAEYQELLGKLNEAEAELEKKQEELEKAKNDAADLREELNQANDKANGLQEEITKLNVRISELEQEQSGNEEEISRLKTQVENLSTQLKTEKEQAAKLLAELTAANERAAQLETENKLLESQVAAAKQEVEAAKLEAQKKAEEEAKKAKEEAAQALAQAQKEAQEAVRKAQEETKKLQAELDALKAAALPKVGDTVKESGVVYRITDAQGKEAQAYRPANKNARSIRILDKVEIQGQAYTVTSIADKAFANMKKLRKATIGKQITAIGARAFYKDQNLKSIILQGTKLESVGKAALKGISGKAVVKTPKGSKKAYAKILKGKGQKKTVKIK